MKDRAADRAAAFRMPDGAQVSACGGGRVQMAESLETPAE
jgi:hypothetical protein